MLPAARKTRGGPEAQRLMEAIQRRLSVIVYVSIAGLALTGILMSRRTPGFAGLFGFGTPYATVLSLKHTTMLAMVAVALGRSLVVPRLQLAAPARARWSTALLLANTALGVLILLLTGFLAALGVRPG